MYAGRKERTRGEHHPNTTPVLSCFEELTPSSHVHTARLPTEPRKARS